MPTRSQKAQRILNVLQQLHTIEEFKKVELQRRLEELETSQTEVIHALNANEALHGLFIDAQARFLRSLAREADYVARERDIQSQKILENATKVKTAERMKDALQKVEQHAENEAELQEIIETHGRRSASPP